MFEGVLVAETLHLLDRALRIDPAARFRDPLEMAGEFEALAQRYRELALRADASVGSGRVGASGEVAPAAPADGGPAGSGARAGARPGGSSGGSEPSGASAQRARASGPRDSAPVGASAPRVLVGEEIVVEEEPGRRPASAPVATKLPGWVGVALVLVLGLQVVQIAIATIALVVALDDEPSPVVAAAPAAPLAAAVETRPAAPVPAAPSVPVPAAAADAAPSVGAGEVATTAPVAAAAAEKGEGFVPKRLGAPVSNAAGSSDETGLVLVSGAQAYLVGSDGRRPVGGVAPGTYELFAQTTPDGKFESQGEIRVSGGERIVYKCGLGTCRRTP
jgi:hypothetical protein